MSDKLVERGMFCVVFSSASSMGAILLLPPLSIQQLAFGLGPLALGVTMIWKAFRDEAKSNERLPEAPSP